MGKKAQRTTERMAALAAEAAALPPSVPLTTQQAAAILQLSVSTMRRRAREDPSFPQPYVIAGYLHRYDRAVLEAYLERCREGKGKGCVFRSKVITESGPK